MQTEKYLITASHDCTIKIWDYKTLKLVCNIIEIFWKFIIHEYFLSSLFIAPFDDDNVINILCNPFGF